MAYRRIEFMTLSKVFPADHPVLSFELFPPKTEKGEASLYSHVEKLMEFQPDFITCTYGAGGSTQAKTLEIIEKVKRDFRVPVASHLTLVNSSVDDLRNYLKRATEIHVDHIVALRGDPPQGQKEFQQAAGGLRHANQLVELIHAEFPHFGVLVAGYPEKHLEAPSLDVDLDNLKRKVDAGADVVVTQLFYDNQDYYRFRDLCQRKGIGIPIIPGILPVTNLHQIQRITSMCGAKLPQPFLERLSEKDTKEWQFEVGVEQAIAQTRDLLDHEIDGLHLYVLNRSKATARILEALDFQRQI